MGIHHRFRNASFPVVHMGTALFLLFIGVLLFIGLHLTWLYVQPLIPFENEDIAKLIFDAVYLAIGITLAWSYLYHRHKFREHQDSEQRLRLFIKHAPVSVAMLDKNMRYLDVSDRWIRSYRLEGLDILGRSHYDVFNFIDFTDELLEMHRRCLNGETIRRQNISFTSLTGTTEWANYEMTPWRYPDDSVGGLIFYTEIITDKKQAEIRLQESEARYLRAINGSRDILWDWDIKTGEVYFNPRLRALLEYDEQEIGTSLSAWKNLIHSNDYPAVKRKLDEHLSTHAPFRVEFRMLSKSGNYLWFEARGDAEQNTQGAPVRMSGFLTDISDKKHLENIKKEFVYIVTHELRTPLTALKGALDMLPILLGKDVPKRVESMLDLAMQGSDRLMTLINDLLTAGEVESETMRFDMKSWPASLMLQRTIDSNAPYGNKYGVGLHLDDFSDNARIVMDENRFMQIMSNLLSNAIKFSPEKGTVFIKAQRDADRLRISITDHGQGIPSEFKQHIFQKFAQHDKNKPGTGLGLNIARTMVERMNGTITFDSVEGKGTTFVISFPIENVK